MKNVCWIDSNLIIWVLNSDITQQMHTYFRIWLTIIRYKDLIVTELHNKDIMNKDYYYYILDKFSSQILKVVLLCWQCIQNELKKANYVNEISLLDHVFYQLVPILLNYTHNQERRENLCEKRFDLHLLMLRFRSLFHKFI